MKKSKIHIALAFLLGTMVFIGCQEERDYPPLKLGTSTAPVVTVANVADSLTESYTYLTLSSTMNGKIFYAILPQGSAAPTVTELVLGETDPASSSIDAVENVSYTVKVKGLESAASYDIYAVATNDVEGKPSEVVGPQSFTCPDNTAPYIVSMTPATGEEWVPKNLSQIVLTMNEPVTLVDAGMIHIVDAFDESDLGVKGTVAVDTIDPSIVTIEITDEIAYFTEVAVLIDAGAFKDATNLLSAEYTDDGTAYLLTFIIEDYVNMENFIGAYKCHETDYVYADEYVYDVLLYQSDAYSISVVNMFNYGVEAYITFEEDSCYIPDQFSGLSGGGDPLNFTSDSLVYGICLNKPGSYTDDGMTIKISCWLYKPATGAIYWASDMEFTKYINAGDKAVPQADPARIARGINPIWRFR